MNISFGSFGSGPAGYKVGRQKFGILQLALMLFIGAAFIVMGLVAFNSGKIDPNWTKVSGTVVGFSEDISDGKTIYAPVVDYTVDSRKYTTTSNVGSSFKPRNGDTQEVAYNPAQPSEAQVVTGTGTKLFILLFPAVGAGLLVGAVATFLKFRLRTRSIDKLVQSGHKLQGVLVDLQIENSGKNSTSYRIVVAATDQNGTVQNYVSDPLGGVGGLAMADFHNNPIPIDVYVDLSNPKHYYVDISDIPNLTPQRIGELIQSAMSKAAVKPN